MHFDHVTSIYSDLPYMKKEQALLIKQLITELGLCNVLELGFYHGKSSAYMAAILEDIGTGHLTTIDRHSALTNEPNIHQILVSLNLQERVSIITTHRSYTWELAKMLQQPIPPQFDLCYLDGGHTWDSTGFGFTLVDKLLKPGGIIIFDDLNWTITESIRGKPERADSYNSYSDEEKNAMGVRIVWEILVPKYKYVNCFEVKEFGWGIAQKAPSS